MLKEILGEIHKSKSFSIANISKKLEAPENLIENSIEQLVRMGYLSKSEMGDSCDIESSACGSCPYASSCSTDLISLYQITEKGKNFLNK